MEAIAWRNAFCTLFAENFDFFDLTDFFSSVFVASSRSAFPDDGMAVVVVPVGLFAVNAMSICGTLAGCTDRGTFACCDWLGSVMANDCRGWLSSGMVNGRSTRRGGVYCPIWYRLPIRLADCAISVGAFPSVVFNGILIAFAFSISSTGGGPRVDRGMLAVPCWLPRVELARLTCRRSICTSPSDSSLFVSSSIAFSLRRNPRENSSGLRRVSAQINHN